MTMLRNAMRRFWYREQGFTLPEVLVAIAVLGIVLAIATSSWFGVIESRRVDSAANQLAADMRLANSRATNQLANWQVVTPSSQNPIRNFELRRLSSSGAITETVARQLPEGTGVSNTVSVTFRPDGQAETSSNTVTVISTNDSSKCRKISINSSTSRIRVEAPGC
jgi:prepilin-type N-terminal cleavage/methylation domain-containing protein